MIEDAQITKASTFEPIVSGNTPEVVNIASTLGKVAEYHDEIETSKTDISNMQDDITDHDNAITELQIDAGKNLINMSNPSYQKGDIVDNHDGTYTLGGTGSWLRMDFDVDVIPGQLYRFKCDFKNVSGPHALFVIRDGGVGDKQLAAKDPLSNNARIDKFFTPTENFVRVVFAPVEVGAPGDTGYMTVNPVLYKVSDNEAATRYLVDTGAKNLLDIAHASHVGNTNITPYTINADGSVNVKATTSSSIRTLGFNVTLKAGVPYVLSGCPTGGSGATYQLDLRYTSGTVIGESVDIGAGSTAFTVPTTDIYRFTVRFADGYNVPSDGITFWPMICTKAVWDVSQKYEPYAMSNAELTTVNALSEITMESGYSLDASSWLYKQGNHYFGNLVIKQSNGFSVGNTTLLTFSKYPYSHHELFGCFTNTENSVWKINGVCFGWINSSNGELTIGITDSNVHAVFIPINFIAT